MKGKNLILNGALSAIILFVAAVCFYPVTNGVSNVQDNVFEHGDRESKHVSLMFNVYWGTDVVYDILGVLDKYGAKCTFFVGGCWADDNAACLKEIAKQGHEIGNHGYFHKDMDRLDYSSNEEEIRINHELIRKTLGIEMSLFAPPSGAYSDNTVKAACDLGYQTILWSRDTVDWRDKDEEIIYQRAISAKGGDFVLMHPMRETFAALDRILKYYGEQGLTCVTVSENLKTQIT